MAKIMDAGTQTSVLPASGSIDAKAVMVAQNKGSCNPKSQYPMPAAVPCIKAISGTPMAFENV